MNRKRWSIGIVVLVFATLVAGSTVACGGGGDDNDKPTATDSLVANTPQGTGSATTLSLEATEFKITGADEGAIPSVSAGEVSVEGKNTGSITHEIVFIKTDTDPGSLPMNGTTVDESAAATVVGEVEDIAAGTTGSANIDLSAGNYALICNIPAHYEQGMYASLTVE